MIDQTPATVGVSVNTDVIWQDLVSDFLSYDNVNMASHLASGGINFGILRESYRRELLDCLDKCAGSKVNLSVPSVLQTSSTSQISMWKTSVLCTGKLWAINEAFDDPDYQYYLVFWSWCAPWWDKTPPTANFVSYSPSPNVGYAMLYPWSHLYQG